MPDHIRWPMFARPGSKVTHLADVVRNHRYEGDTGLIVVECGRDITYDRTPGEPSTHPYVPSSRHGEYDICSDCRHSLRRHLANMTELLEDVEGWS
jgi:hypothetical protein